MKGIELRYHPDETCFISGILPDENGAYIADGEEYRSDGLLYRVLTVSFHYKINAAIGCGWRLFPTSKALGYHPHDIEHVSLYAREGKVKYVYFAAHSTGQGCWVPWSECKRNEGRLVIYVARGSHACYPHPETYWRVFGLANDACSSSGKHEVINTMWVSYDAKLTDGVQLYRGLRPPPPATSITLFNGFSCVVVAFHNSTGSSYSLTNHRRALFCSTVST